MTHYVPVMNKGKILSFFIANSFTGYEAMVSVETAELMKEIEDLAGAGKDRSEQVKRLLEIDSQAYWNFID
jgi:hypothetical protein